MRAIGYHASHEQHRPSELLALARKAEEVGFGALSCSDHLKPWGAAQGHSGFAWSWLGAALAATRLPATTVTSPGQRYHPAIIAQAVATLSEMFPDRFFVIVGSGEAVNELVTGEEWPRKAERNERLRECVEIMRALWRGETVNHDGRVRVRNAKLYTLPARPPVVAVAAISAETAAWCAPWADALVTISQPRKKLATLLEAFRSGAKERKPVHLQIKLSYAREGERALKGAFDQWKTNVFPSSVLSDLETPEHFEALAGFAREEDITDHVRVSADLREHEAWIQDDISQGFEGLYLHNVNPWQEEFLEDFGEGVLPRLRK